MVDRAAVVATFESWVGQTERTGANDHWIADEWGITGHDWCAAAYQSAFWHTGGVLLPHQSMYVPYFVQWARDHGEAIEVSDARRVRPGDAVLFTWDRVNWPRWKTGTGSHIGMVRTPVVDGWFTTIEGNVGRPVNGVVRLDRPLDDSVICFWSPPVFDDRPITLPQQEDDMFEQNDRDTLAAVVDAAVALSGPLRDIYLALGIEGAANDEDKRDRVVRRLHRLVRDEVREAIASQPGPLPPVSRPPNLPPVPDEVETRVASLEERLARIEGALVKLLHQGQPAA